MRKIRSNDEVVVITGKDKATRRGKVMQVLANGKVLVQGINRVKTR